MCPSDAKVAFAKAAHVNAQDRIGKLEDLSSVLKAKIERLTVENAGLRAHNEALLDAEAGTVTPNKASLFHSVLCYSDSL